MTSVWFLLAHPDDEFAVTALIRDRCRDGHIVRCVYLTDGSFSGMSPSIRRKETMAVLSRLGVSPDRAHFIGQECGFADGALCSSLEPALGALTELLESTGEPGEIFSSAWEGGHQDHDAVCLLALAVTRQLGYQPRLRQFPLYHGAGLPGPWFRLLDPLPANGPTEERASNWRDRIEQLRTGLSYPSQWRTWLGLFPFLAWHVLTDGRFRTQGLDPLRILCAPHPGPLLYQRRGYMTYAEFRAYADPFIASRGLVSASGPASK